MGLILFLKATEYVNIQEYFWLQTKKYTGVVPPVFNIIVVKVRTDKILAKSFRKIFIF